MCRPSRTTFVSEVTVTVCLALASHTLRHPVREQLEEVRENSGLITIKEWTGCSIPTFEHIHEDSEWRWTLIADACIVRILLTQMLCWLVSFVPVSCSYFVNVVMWF